MPFIYDCSRGVKVDEQFREKAIIEAYMNEHLKTPRNRAAVEKLIWYAVKEWRDREAFDAVWESDYVNIHSDDYPLIVHKKVAQFLGLKSVPVTHRKWTTKKEVSP